MRYLITVVHDGPEPTDVPAALFEEMGKLVAKLEADGVLVDAAGLAPMAKARRIVLRAGDVAVVDGPFAETKEWIGGYFIVSVDDEAAALEVARTSIDLHRIHFPGFDITHEVRRIMEE